jgi:expansin
MHQPPKPPPRRVRSPLRAWVWAAAGVLAIVLLGASALRFATASCALELAPAVTAAAPDSPAWATAVTRGEAYFYDPRAGVGSCSFGPLAAGGLYVSLGSAQYAGGSACGSYLEVSGPRGSVRAEVVDECPGCADGGIDMSEAAFSRIASPDAGTAQVSYRVVRDPRLPGPVELRVAPSASAAWLAVQVINNGNPLSSVQVTPLGRGAKARWQSLVLDPDDYWAVPAGDGPGPFAFRITDVFGHQIVVRGIRLAPGAVQDTRVLMYDAASASPPKTAPVTTAPASRAPAGPAAPSGTIAPPVTPFPAATASATSSPSAAPC